MCGMEWNECNDTMQTIGEQVIRKSFLIHKAIVHVITQYEIANDSAPWVNLVLPTIYCFY